VVGIAGPTFRIKPMRKEEIGQIVKKAGIEISHQMGYTEIYKRGIEVAI